MNKNTYILVNKSSNGDNNIQCIRRLILGIVTYARIAFQLHVYQWTRHGPLEPAVTCSTPL